MKTKLFPLLGLLFVVSGISAQPRFFKENSVRVRYEYYYPENILSNGRRHNVALDTEAGADSEIITKYATMWLGNDTIIDGYACVELWNQDDGEEPECVGAIREDENGYVWRHGTTPHVNRRNSSKYDRWMFLYDFSRSDWKVGDSLNMFTGEHRLEYEPVEIMEVSNTMLLNGDNAPSATNALTYTLVYGLGYLAKEHPFEGHQATMSNLIGGNILEYWRDGKLLYKTEGSLDIVDTLSSEESSPLFYDLLGRPTSHPTPGIYIQNGRKVMMR